MSGQRPIPAPDSPEARVLPADLLAEADCLRQLALLEPDGCFRLPYVYLRSSVNLPYIYRGARGYVSALCEARLLVFSLRGDGSITYDDFMLRAEDSRRRGEESARKRLPPGLERLLESDYVFAWLEPQEVYPRVVRHLLESGYLDRYPEIREQAEAALTLGGLL
jgi:hypothetical protein